MFEWLEEEMESVRTPGFHVVDGPANPKLREAVANSGLPVPLTYKEFVLRFGNAKLYRQSRCGYTVGVFAGPRTVELEGGTANEIGFRDSSSVYVLSRDGPVYEAGVRPEHVAAANFEEWLKTSCVATRKGFSHAKWSQILRGPAPFSSDESHIIETRKRFEWKVVEIDPSGDRVFEVTNRSDGTLPVLTIGVRSKDRRLNGVVRLNVSHVDPGESTVVRVACYKDVFPPEEIEVFSLPDPQPEDREYYAEFGVGS